MLIVVAHLWEDIKYFLRTYGKVVHKTAALYEKLQLIHADIEFRGKSRNPNVN